MTVAAAITAIDQAVSATAALRAEYEAARAGAGTWDEKQEFVRRVTLCDGVAEALGRAGDRASELL